MMSREKVAELWPIVEAAEEAFLVDESYAARIERRARRIEAIRAKWAEIMKQRGAEQ